MYSQEPNQQNYNTQQPRPRMKLGYIITPLLLNFGVVLLVQIVFCMAVFMNIFSTYITENSEINEVLVELLESDADITYDSVESVLSTETIDDLTDIWIEAVDENAVLITIICSLVTLPVFLWLMKRDKKKPEIQALPVRVGQDIWKYIFIVIGGSALCIALNNLLTLSQLAEVSQAYQEASEELYSASYMVQLIGLGVIAPFAEELLFRGVLYNRLKAFLKPTMAGMWSAMIFAAYHGNMVQFIYAMISGIMLVWVYERYGSLKAPILAHICMNLTSIVLTQYDWFIWIFSDAIRMTCITVASAAVAAMMYIMIDNHTKNKLETL